MISPTKCSKNLSTEWLRNHCTCIKKIKEAHAFLLRNRLIGYQHAVSKLVSFLALSQSGDLCYARKVFSQIEQPDMFIWNTMIRGYAKGSSPYEAVLFYGLMIRSGVVPDKFTYPFVLTACARSRDPNAGRIFHAAVLKLGLESDAFVLNSLIQMYTSCGLFDAACGLFDGNPCRDVVSWNTMIGGYVRAGLYDQAFDCFEEMKRINEVQPDTATMVSLFSACAQLGDLDRGRLIHSFSKEHGLEINLHLGNAVLDMYCKCGDLASARQLFYNMPERDMLTWTSMISGLASSGHFQESLVLFRQMQYQKIQLDEVTLVCVLSACAQTGALDQGKYIHLLIERYRIDGDVVLGTALIDMYAKCGSGDLALQVFYKMTVKNVFTWNAMIGGLAMNGHGQRAVGLFEQMRQGGRMPDDVTFVGALSACSHAGLVDEGLKIFSEMKEIYEIEPRMEHYGCIVDLLCRAGHEDRALAFIESMPIKPNAILWATVLRACSIRGDFLIAEKIGKHVIELEPDSCGRYVMLSNVYAGANRWDDALQIRNQMKFKGIEKATGFSWIEVNGMVHQFVAGDRSHSQTEQIYKMVEEIRQRVKLEGHVTGTTVVLFDINEEEKEHSLYLHSEKLAVAFGLMSTAPSLLIRIVKNLRVCNDCHSFLKIVSKVFGREIIARDRSRFHHFREGSCSCMDFW